MKTLEATGKTYEEALMAGLAQMGLPSDKVDVEVLEEGSKGFLGIGAKPYRLRLTKKDTPALRAEEFLQNVTELMGLDVVLDVQDEEEALRIEMQGDNQGILIGHRGETLDALQYLTSLLVNKGGKEYRRVTLDTEGYRAKREQTLIHLAQRMAAKVCYDILSLPVKRADRPLDAVDGVGYRSGQLFFLCDNEDQISSPSPSSGQSS